MRVGNLCLMCKGSRKLCGNTFCPVLSGKEVIGKLDPGKLKSFSGSSPPNIFIGSFDYPDVNVAPLVTELSGDTSLYGVPENWLGLGYERIVRLRVSLMRANIKKANVKDVENPLLTDLAVAKRSVDTEIEVSSFKRSVSFSNFLQPMGPALDVKRIEITSNPYPDRRIEGVVYDDLKAAEAVDILYKDRVPVSRISQVLSAGQLGLKRKLVPTRWSITATDDIISKHLLSYVKDYATVDSYMVFETEALGNHYVVLLFPSAFCFELMEAWFSGSLWAKETVIVSDHELYGGRKTYASNVTGSYYAARLAVAECLNSMQRQAGCIVFREVYSSYILPLGVWQVRENMREAMRAHESFNSMGEALGHIKSRLHIPIEQWLSKSRVFHEATAQRKLSDFWQKSFKPPATP